MANEDLDYLRWVGRQLCACGCGRQSGPPHHPRHDVGLALRAHDHRAIPLSPKCHESIHRLTFGSFKGWSREQVRAFCDREGARFRERYLDLDPRSWEHDGIPF